MADIDSLEIEISAESGEAAQKVNALAQALERLKSVLSGGGFDSIGKQIRGVGEGAGAAQERLSKRQKMMENVRAQIQSPGMSLKQSAKNVRDLTSMVSSAARVERELGLAEKRAEKFGQELINLQDRLDQELEFAPEFRNTDAIRDISAQMEGLDQKAQNADDTVRKLRDTLANIKSKIQTADLEDSWQESEAVSRKMQAMQRAMKAIDSTKLKITNELQRAEIQAAKTNGRISDMQHTLDRLYTSNGLENLEVPELDYAQESLDLFAESADKISGKIESVRNALDRLDKKEIDLMSPDAEKEIGETSLELQALAGQFHDLQHSSNLAGEEAKNAMKEAENAVKDLRNSMDFYNNDGFTQAFENNPYLSTASGKIHGAFEDFQKFHGEVSAVTSALGRRFTRPFFNAISAFSNWKKSIGKMAVYRAINAAINTVTEGMKTGINNLYQYSSLVGTQFAPAMNSLATSSQYLKNSLGSMAAPLLQAVAPAVDYLIDKFVALLNVIGKVFAALTGKSTYTQAVRAAASYGDAVGGVGDAAGGAAKELNDYMMGIDELNVISAAAGGGGGGGGGGGLGFGDMFEEVEIPNEIADFAAQIREAIEKGDWMGAGGILAEKLNQVVLQWDPSHFGELLGNKLNQGIEFSYGFLKIFEGEELGRKIAQGVNAFVERIKAELMGRAAAAFQNLKFDVVIGFSSTLNWEGIGDKLAGFINGFINEIDPQKAAEAVNTTLKGILAAATAFFEKTKWKELGETIGAFISNIEWVEILGGTANVIAKALEGVFKTAFGLVAAGLSGNPENFLGNALSVAAGGAIALVTTTYLAGLLESIGTKLSQLSATKKLLASTVLVAIEFAVNQWSITKFIETGDIQKLGINLFSTAAASYLLYRMWGPAGLAIGIGVALAANISAISLAIANGVSMTDPNVIIAAAITAAIGGVGGAVLAHKVGISGGAGFVIGIALALSCTISAVNFAKVASGQIDANSAESVFMSVISSALMGVAGAALVTATGIATGGVGFAIGLAVGLVVNITGVVIANQEYIKNTINESIFGVLKESGGGVLVSKLGLQFERLAQQVGNAFSSMNSVDLDSMNGTIITASDQIRMLMAEAANGAISIEEAAASMNNSFNSIADTIIEKFTGTREMLLSGLYGPFEEIADMLGVTIPSLETLIIGATERGIQGVQEAQAAINEYSAQLKNGEISLEEYSAKVGEQYEAMKKLGGVGNEMADVISSYHSYMNGMKLDLSEIVDDTQLNTERLGSILGGMNTSYTESIADIEKYTADYIEGWKFLIDSGTLTAEQVETAQDAIAAALKVKDSHISDLKASYGQVIDATQTELINRLGDVVAQLQADYSKLSPGQQLLKTEEKFVKEGLANYQANVVAPMLSTIQSGMEEIGIQGEPWANEAIEKITDALFPDGFRWERKGDALLSDLSSIIKSTMEGVKTQTIPDAEDVGGFLIDGIASGILNGITANQSAFENGFSKVTETAESVFEINSPSRVFARLGEFLPAGLLQGMNNGWGDVLSFFSGKLGDITTNFSKTWDKIRAEAETAWGNIKQNLGAAWENIKTTAGNTFDSVKEGIGTAWENTQAATTEIWNGVASWLGETWNSIFGKEEKTFGDIHRDIKQKWADTDTDTNSKWSAIDTFLNSTWDGLETNSKTIFDTIYGTIEKNWNDSETKTDASWNAQDGLLRDIWNGLEAASETSFKLMYEAVDTNWSSAEQKTESSWSAQDTLLKDIWGGLKTTSEISFGAMYEAVDKSWTDSSASTTSNWSSIVTTTNTKTAEALAAVKANFGKVSGAVTSGLQAAKTAAEGISFYSVGTNIVDGVSAGVRAKADALASTVSASIRMAADAARAAAQINSPSRLFRDSVGVFLGLGIAEGVKDSAKDIVSTIQDVNAQMLEAFDPNVFQSPEPMEFPVHQEAVSRVQVAYTYDSQHEEDTAQRLGESVRVANEDVVNTLYAVAAQLVEAIGQAADRQPGVYLDGRQIMQNTEKHQRQRGANIMARSATV